MFGILNATFRVATLTQTPERATGYAQSRAHCPSRRWFDETPRDSRTGFAPGESWTDRNTCPAGR